MLPSRVRSQFAVLVAVVVGVVAAFVFNGVHEVAGGGSFLGENPTATLVTALQVSLGVSIATALLTWATGASTALGRVFTGGLVAALIYLGFVFFGINPGFAWVALGFGFVYGALCGGGYHVGKRLSDNA
jgi:hypothetical protein